MPYQLADTIVAIASAAGGAARGIVRASGPQVVRDVASICDPNLQEQLANCRDSSVFSGELCLPALSSALPVEVYLWPTRRSYTREPLVELHLPGSPPLLAATVDALVAAGARLAEPGEFTLRAFLAGRLDLTQAEAVAAVVDAPGQEALGAALEQLAGGLAEPLACLRGDLLDLLADLEAGLDFVDEAIEFIGSGEVRQRLRDAVAKVIALTGQLDDREPTGDRPLIVLVGAPNTGKSSLLNALAGRTAAVVSPIPGTTRDWVQTTLDIGGRACDLVDTAGVVPQHLLARSGCQTSIEPTPGATASSSISAVPSSSLLDKPAVAPRPGLETQARSGPPCNSLRAIETRAAHHANEQFQRANIVVVCCDGSRVLTANELLRLTELCLSPEEAGANRPWVLAITKTDLSRRLELPDAIPAERVVRTSSVSKGGVDELMKSLNAQVEAHFAQRARPIVQTTALRCRTSLRTAAEALDRAQSLAERSDGDELIAAEIRLALDELGAVAGAVYTDDLLDRVFSRFCIGK